MSISANVDMEPDEEVSKVNADMWKAWRVRRTVWEMLQDRGYHVLPGSLSMTYDEYEQNFGNAGEVELRIVASRRSDPDEKISVFFPAQPKISIRDIRAYAKCAEVMDGEGISAGIIVIKDSLNPYGKRGIEALNKTGKRLEPFLEVELVVNVTKHDVVPRHVVLSSEEKQQVLKQYNVSDNQLPRLLARDPVARYLGLARGQVVRIERKSATAKQYITYRFVA